ncbi:MAG: cytidylate kinase-like family protein [Desulfocapsaceae bacterium]|nr:cytidylate kinase-like family protein [Desulfocapsaceae bacterium]
MPIITISRGSYYHGRSVAEKLAHKLGYRCLSRNQVIEDLEEFHLPEIKLVRGLHDTFSILDRFPHGKARFKTAMRSALLQHFLAGNIVYHGRVGHYFVRDLSHVLKVRIISDLKSRIASDMAWENMSLDEARHILMKDDDERRKWGMFLYGIDIMDPVNYNMVLRIGHISEDEAVDLIARAASLPAFQETAESKKALADSALAALVDKTLFDFPHAAVSAHGGQVAISLKAPEDQQPIIYDRIGEMIGQLPGVESYVVNFEPYF